MGKETTELVFYLKEAWSTAAFPQLWVNFFHVFFIFLFVQLFRTYKTPEKYLILSTKHVSIAEKISDDLLLDRKFW